MRERSLDLMHGFSNFYLRTTRLQKLNSIFLFTALFSRGSSLPSCVLINHECLDKKSSSYYQAQFSIFFFSMECWLPKTLAILLAVKSNLYLDPMKLPKVLFIFSALSKSLSGWLSNLSNLHLLGIGECFKVKSHRLSRHLNEFPTCSFAFCFVFLINPDCLLVFVEGVACYKLFSEMKLLFTDSSNKIFSKSCEFSANLCV